MFDTYRAPRAISAPRQFALLASALAVFMTQLDNNVVNVAIPTIEHSLHLSQAGIEWVVSAYVLFFAGLLLAGGRLVDVFGRRRLFTIGIVLFTGASLLAGLSSSATMLIGTRALQGVGAALLTPTTLAIITHAYREPKEQAKAIGVWGAVGALSLAVGPVIGGILTQHVTWNWIFFLNVPIGLATLVIGRWAVPSDDDRVRRSLDVGGIVLSTTTLFALTYGLIEGTRDGWTSLRIVSAFAVALIGAALFVLQERRVSDPMLDVALFRIRQFTTGTTVLIAWAFGLFGIYFFTAIYLQNVLGFSATKAGVAFVPMALLMAVGAVISDQIVAKVGPNRLVAAAMGTMALGIASVSLLGQHASFLSLMPSLAIIGIGGGFTIPLTSVVVNTMPLERAGIASAIFNASREVAGLLGVTVIGVVLSAHEHSALRAGHTPVVAFLDGYRWGLGVAAALVGVGALLAMRTLPRHVAHARANASLEINAPIRHGDDLVATAL